MLVYSKQRLFLNKSSNVLHIVRTQKCWFTESKNIAIVTLQKEELQAQPLQYVGTKIADYTISLYTPTVDYSTSNFGSWYNQGPSSQGYGFSVVMYGCERWTVKKAER